MHADGLLDAGLPQVAGTPSAGHWSASSDLDAAAGRLRELSRHACPRARAPEPTSDRCCCGTCDVPIITDMQSSSVVFNTKPVFAAIHANCIHQHSKDSSNSTLITANFNLVPSKNPITLRQKRCRSSCTRPVSSQNSWGRFSLEYHGLKPQLQLRHKCQQVSCFQSFKRKHVGLKRFTSQLFVDNSILYLPKHKLNNAKFDSPAREVHIPFATVGPEEPHAASTAWPDSVTD
ncbi:Unknown protein [Striga hermonthica]|uniref:Uncharacterized protein n=1 Tax=Striga hermonthica TaxID=68872 RepID=A0A9N7R4R3_STRHE|nr:Unknown protein [Striga hermonthica]